MLHMQHTFGETNSTPKEASIPMAHSSTHHDASLSLSGAFHRFSSALGNIFLAWAESDSRLRQMEALNALSDAELAERGLRRDEIARFVFKDVFWG
jgi:uncharacterized protein YjiS (DUF1127 family)